MSLFKELQRRNVFRVAIGYVGTSCLFALVADLVLENNGAPDWVMQTILLVSLCAAYRQNWFVTFGKLMAIGVSCVSLLAMFTGTVAFTSFVPL